ncbi:MAG: hypothetical protein F6K11_28070 [Leptolyngbya sp. SIO3F4]|nr:hypothetical protein [Leptolyngbya sp. SIO3F4]
MSIQKSEIARCGACRFYTPIGRRGGECSQFGVPVRSGWTSCCLAESPFQKVTKVNNSDMKLSRVALEKVTVEKELAAESLSVSARRFKSAEKYLAVKVSQ